MAPSTTSTSRIEVFVVKYNIYNKVGVLWGMLAGEDLNI